MGVTVGGSLVGGSVRGERRPRAALPFHGLATIRGPADAIYVVVRTALAEANARRRRNPHNLSRPKPSPDRPGLNRAGPSNTTCSRFRGVGCPTYGSQIPAESIPWKRPESSPR